MKSQLTRQMLAALLLPIFVLASQAQAKVFSRFHPYQSTLQEMADYIKDAERSVDIAVYNIDANKRNPIIAIKSIFRKNK